MGPLKRNSNKCAKPNAIQPRPSRSAARAAEVLVAVAFTEEVLLASSLIGSSLLVTKPFLLIVAAGTRSKCSSAMLATAIGKAKPGDIRNIFDCAIVIAKNNKVQGFELLRRSLRDTFESKTGKAA